MKLNVLNALCQLSLLAESIMLFSLSFLIVMAFIRQ